MGLSSSQARLLNLTARMHQIEYGAARIEAMKLQMANESRRVYEDYLEALDKTKLQVRSLTTNGAVTFRDVTSYEDFLAAGFALVVHGLPSDFEFSEGNRSSAPAGRINSPRPNSTSGTNGATYTPYSAVVIPRVNGAVSNSVNSVNINSGDVVPTVVNPDTQQAIFGDSLTPVDGGDTSSSGNNSASVVQPKSSAGTSTVGTASYSVNTSTNNATASTNSAAAAASGSNKDQTTSGTSSSNGNKIVSGDSSGKGSVVKPDSSDGGKASNSLAGRTNSATAATSTGYATTGDDSSIAPDSGKITPTGDSNSGTGDKSTYVVSGGTASALVNTGAVATGTGYATINGDPDTTPDSGSADPAGGTTSGANGIVNGNKVVYTNTNGLVAGKATNLVNGGTSGGTRSLSDPVSGTIVNPLTGGTGTMGTGFGTAPLRGGSDPDPDPDPDPVPDPDPEPTPRGVSSGSSVICRTVGQLVEAIKALYTGPDGSPLDISSALYSNFETLLTNLINSGNITIIEKPTGADDFPEIGTLEYADYETSIAINTKLQEVADDVEIRKAEAKYEADMKRIDMKDRRYDSDLAALDNERNAIKQEMETMKTIAKDNVERTFKIFG